MSENASAMVEALKEWHAKFDVPSYGVPRVPHHERRELRVRLIIEEAKEFTEASDAGDIVGVADGIADLLYVVIGAALEWGIDADACFAEVHRSNMTKVWTDGTVHYREDGKVMKPPTYSPADIKGVLGL